MKRKILLLLLLLCIDLVVITLVLKQDLASKDFTIVIPFIYAILLNFLLAGVLSRTKIGQYSGLFVINAIAMPLLMYLYT